jgi:hypothetical protein
MSFSISGFTGFSATSRRKRDSQHTLQPMSAENNASDDVQGVSAVLEFVEMVVLQGHQLVPNPWSQAALERPSKRSKPSHSTEGARAPGGASHVPSWLAVTSNIDLYAEYTRYCQPYPCLETQSQFCRVLRQVVPSIAMESRHVLGTAPAGGMSPEAVQCVEWPSLSVAKAETERYRFSRSHGRTFSSGSLSLNGSWPLCANRQAVAETRQLQSLASTDWSSRIVEPRTNSDDHFYITLVGVGDSASPHDNEDVPHYQPRQPWQQPRRVRFLSESQSSSESESGEDEQDDADSDDGINHSDEEAVAAAAAATAAGGHRAGTEQLLPTLGDVLSDFLRYYWGTGLRDKYSGPPLVAPPLTFLDDPFNALRGSFNFEFEVELHGGSATPPPSPGLNTTAAAGIFNIDGSLVVGGTDETVTLNERPRQYEPPSSSSPPHSLLVGSTAGPIRQQDQHHEREPLGLQLLLNVGVRSNFSGSGVALGSGVLGVVGGLLGGPVGLSSGRRGGRLRGKGSRGGRGAYVRARKEREAREARETFLAQNAGLLSNTIIGIHENGSAYNSAAGDAHMPAVELF